MAAQTPPYAQQNGSHTAALFRQAFTSLFGATQPGTLASTAGGVVNTTDLAVTAQASPNMTVNVAGGSSWIPQTQAANGGLYFGLNDATVVVAIAASSGTNPRVDLICATVNDAAYSGSTNNWTIQAITGTPTAGATLINKNGAGALPVASIPLAYVLVPASSTSVTTGNIQDARTFMGMPNANRSNPAGRMISTTQATLISTTVQITGFASVYAKGGVTVASNALTVPVAGVYSVKAGTTFQTSSGASAPPSGFYEVFVYKNGAAWKNFRGYITASAALPDYSMIVVEEDLLAAGDSLTVYAYSSGTVGTSINSANPSFLAVSLVSQ